MTVICEINDMQLQKEVKWNPKYIAQLQKKCAAPQEGYKIYVYAIQIAVKK